MTSTSNLKGPGSTLEMVERQIENGAGNDNVTVYKRKEKNNEVLDIRVNLMSRFDLGNIEIIEGPQASLVPREKATRIAKNMQDFLDGSTRKFRIRSRIFNVSFLGCLLGCVTLVVLIFALLLQIGSGGGNKNKNGDDDDDDNNGDEYVVDNGDGGNTGAGSGGGGISSSESKDFLIIMGIGFGIMLLSLLICLVTGGIARYERVQGKAEWRHEFVDRLVAYQKSFKRRNPALTITILYPLEKHAPVMIQKEVPDEKDPDKMVTVMTEQKHVVVLWALFKISQGSPDLSVYKRLKLDKVVVRSSTDSLVIPGRIKFRSTRRSTLNTQGLSNREAHERIVKSFLTQIDCASYIPTFLGKGFVSMAVICKEFTSEDKVLSILNIQNTRDRQRIIRGLDVYRVMIKEYVKERRRDKKRMNGIVEESKEEDSNSLDSLGSPKMEYSVSAETGLMRQPGFTKKLKTVCEDAEDDDEARGNLNAPSGPTKKASVRGLMSNMMTNVSSAMNVLKDAVQGGGEEPMVVGRTESYSTHMEILSAGTTMLGTYPTGSPVPPDDGGGMFPRGPSASDLGSTAQIVDKQMSTDTMALEAAWKEAKHVE